MSARFVLAGLLAGVLCAGPASGALVVVPDQHATITAAIATGADTVLVRDGNYPETVVIARPLVLARFDLEGPPASRPQVTSFLLALGPGGWAHVAQFHVTQNVPLTTSFNGPDLWLDRCVLDSGISRGAALGPRLRLTGCAVTGDVALYQWSVELMGNIFAGGGLDVDYEAYATLSDNWISGAPGFAITLRDNDSDGAITDNVIWSCAAGIHVNDPSGTRIERNLVESCDGDGIRTERVSQGGVAHVVDNVLRDLGGDGVYLGSLGGDVVGNRIERVTKAGIRVIPNVAASPIRDNRVVDTGEGGVLAGEENFVPVFARNTILRAGGPGAWLFEAGRADSNVIGRSRGDGLFVANLVTPFGAAHNTFFLNGGSGLRVDAIPDGVITANIGYGNGAFALDWLGLGTPTLSCNLAFGNHAGSVQGAVPSETDRDGDPLFCNLPADDVHIGPGSAAILAGCETAGALGPGCARSAGVEGTSASALLRFGPQPARAVVRFESAATSPLRIEVFDLAGARRWARVLPPGSGALEWDLRDARGARLAPGVYFVRATSAGAVTNARLVVAR